MTGGTGAFFVASLRARGLRRQKSPSSPASRSALRTRGKLAAMFRNVSLLAVWDRKCRKFSGSIAPHSLEIRHAA